MTFRLEPMTCVVCRWDFVHACVYVCVCLPPFTQRGVELIKTYKKVAAGSAEGYTRRQRGCTEGVAVVVVVRPSSYEFRTFKNEGGLCWQETFMMHQANGTSDVKESKQRTSLAKE